MAGGRNSARGRLGRASQRAVATVLHRWVGVGRWLMHPRRRARLAHVPLLPVRCLPRLRSPARPWTAPVAPVPEELRTQPGIRRDPEREAASAAATPLRAFFPQHPQAAPMMGYMWLPLVSAAPRLGRATRRIQRTWTDRRQVPAEPVDPAELRRRLGERAAGLGLSAVGVAPYDEKYTFAEFRDRVVGDRMVVAVLEQNWAATQTIPALGAERAALNTYGELSTRLVALAEWLESRGHRARVEPFDGESMVIHYAVEAGLGQLGLNGQLLTAHAGSRCRIGILSTDAPLPVDGPVDLGIEGVCDRCRVCVRRCPVGAIPARRADYRGVHKPKLNTKRCLPVVAQAEGCAVCMKVCPVQRFGLARVLDEYRATGRILGKDTDELEGYDWPLDGRHYPPGATPRVPAHIANPPGFALRPEPPTNRGRGEPELAAR